MANKFWTTQNKKYMASAALLLLAWYQLQMFDKVPGLPSFFTKAWFGSISIMTVAAAFSLYVIYMIWTEY